MGDGRRIRHVYKRKVQEMEADKLLLQDLLQAIRIGDSNQLDSLINLIKKDTPQLGISFHINSVFGFKSETLSTPESSSVVSAPRSESPSGKRPFGVYGIVRPPVIVPAKPWTTVTDSDELVSHLVSLWFTWCHWWCHWFNGQQFVDAMKAGDVDTPLCTRCLVNLVLADACVCTLPNLHISSITDLRSTNTNRTPCYMTDTLQRSCATFSTRKQCDYLTPRLRQMR